jgi:5,10-methylenetetrahydromethanopterin reductase
VTVSVMHGQQVDRLDDLAGLATLAEEHDVRLWLGQSFALDSQDALSALAGRGHRVSAGLAVAVAPLRSPFDAALRARSVATLLQRPLTVAYGIGSLTAAAALLGRPLERPGTFVRDYVAEVRRLLDDGPTGRSLFPLEAPPVEVGCGVLRRRMARLAGEVADVAVTWLAPLPHLSGALLPALAEGAEAVGRPRPRVISVVQCAVARPGRVPPRLAQIACGSHLRLPHYRAMLAEAGLALPGRPAGDLRAAVEAGLFAYGSPADLAATVRAHLDAGVDEVVLNAGAVGIEHGTAAAGEDLREVLAEVLPARRTRTPLSSGRTS